MNTMPKGNQIDNKLLRFMFLHERGENEEERRNSGSLQLTQLYSASLHGCEEQNTVNSYVGPTRQSFASEIEKG